MYRPGVQSTACRRSPTSILLLYSAAPFSHEYTSSPPGAAGLHWHMTSKFDTARHGKQTTDPGNQSGDRIREALRALCKRHSHSRELRSRRRGHPAPPGRTSTCQSERHKDLAFGSWISCRVAAGNPQPQPRTRLTSSGLRESWFVWASSLARPFETAPLQEQRIQLQKPFFLCPLQHRKQKKNNVLTVLDR